MTAVSAAAGPSASLQVARLMAVSLGIAGVILFALDFSLVVAQAHYFAVWWSGTAAVAVLGASVAVAFIGAFGSSRATTVSFIVLAGSLLVPAMLAFVALPPGGVGQQPWLADLAVIGAAAAGAGLPVPAAIGYLVVLLGSLAAEAAILVEPSARESSLVHLGTAVFYTALFTALAIASRRAGHLLDLAVRSAVTDVSAAAAAEARRAQRRRVEGLIHDTLIVALLSFGRGRTGDEGARREAARALGAIEALEASAGPADDPTARELAWRLQGLTTELEARIRFDYDVDGEDRVPAPVAEAVAEAMSEAVRNSLRHAGPADRVARQVTVDVDGGGVRVVVLDDGVGFETAAVDPTRLGIREGIVHRMALVGGRAQVLSTARRGTTVVLEWSRS